MADFWQEVNPAHIFTHKNRNYLKSDIITASLSTSYSHCVELVRAWFLSKFDPDFFDYVYIEGSNVLKESLKPKESQLIHKRTNRASLIINPQIDEEFTNDGRDAQMAGTDLYLNYTSSLAPFLKDVKNNRCISLEMELLSMTFNFRIKVHSRAQQLDLYQYMRKAFRIGYTESYYVDQDFLLPRKLMLCIAEDAGFTLDENGNVSDVFKFLSYLNSVSMIPILYKVRTATGSKEYYGRFAEAYVHFAMNNLSKDDGDRPNHLASEFGVEMNMEVKFPAPAYYAYHTNNVELQTPKFDDNANDTSFAYTINTIKWNTIPDTNDKGWLLYVKDVNGYLEENLTEPLVIEFKEYFEGELLNLINAHLNKYISPALFMDLKIFNDGKVMDGTMNWDKLIWTSKDIPTTGLSSIALYMDMEYVNTQRIIGFDMMGLNNRIGNEKLR